MKKVQLSELLYIVFTLIVSASFLYSYYRINTLTKETETLATNITSLETKLATTTAKLEQNLATSYNNLTNLLNEQKVNVAEKLGNYEQQFGNISGTVNTLQKLSKTDPELLQKYSKVFFLNEYYAPARLEEVTSEYKYSNTRTVKLHADVWPYMKRMLDDAKNNGITMYVHSGYRSFNEQQAIKGGYKVSYGAGTANQFSADQGYSEHQLGTAVDLITTGMNGDLDGFDKTSSYNWLLANAYRYGFIISYPKDNKFYVFEPWHWRFVGVKLATDLHNQGQNFYDLDQRKIDEYLVTVFE